MNNKQFILKNRPVGAPDETTWEFQENEIPELHDGEILVQHHYI